MHGAGTVGPVLHNHAGAHAEEYGQIGKNQHAGELFHDAAQRLWKSIQTDVTVVAHDVDGAEIDHACKGVAAKLDCKAQRRVKDITHDNVQGGNTEHCDEENQNAHIQDLIHRFTHIFHAGVHLLLFN